MVTRRRLLTGVAAAAVALTPGLTATDAHAGVGAGAGAFGWPENPRGIRVYRVAGSAATVALLGGAPAAVLLHIARRWHYEIAAIDTGEGGGIEGYDQQRAIRTALDEHYRSGTAVALQPTAYPAGGSEPLWPHQEAIVLDILIDCGGTVSWGGHLTPTAASHFHIAVPPGDRKLAQTAARLDTNRHRAVGAQTAGRVSDPATATRRDQARHLPVPR